LKSNTYSEATTQYFFSPSATPFIEATGRHKIIARFVSIKTLVFQLQSIFKFTVGNFLTIVKPQVWG
ncbi:hypothetical protein, partial [Legionella pneumophila]|uniref:hypothetical protein n=1 Tax=Legionella pneumophila TaxID=446 RepID=UPI001E44D64D